MPLFMENRFRTLIILVVFLTLIYGAEAIALSGTSELEVEISEEPQEPLYNDSALTPDERETLRRLGITPYKKQTGENQ